MQVRFNDKLLSDYYSVPIKELGKTAVSREVIKHYRRKIQITMNATDLSEIRPVTALHLEKLKEDKYKDCWSIRANDQYRIIFKVEPEGPVSILVIELSKHYA